MIKIISIFDKNEDFIEMQYNSIKKYLKGNFEYIIYNNGSTEEQKNIIEEICNNLGIINKKIYVNYHTNPSMIVGDALNIIISELRNEKIFNIDSDMFFINELNIDDIFNKADFSYVPIYRDSLPEIMWSGIFGINFNKVNFDIDCRPQVLQNTDTFGHSALINKEDNKNLFRIYNINDNKDNILKVHINNDCVLHFKNHELIYNERPHLYNETNINGFDKLYNKFNDVLILLNKYKFPSDMYNTDVIEINNTNTIVHFKSSNWIHDLGFNWFTDEYIKNKKESIKKLINKEYENI
jgi:hypothetical protein